MRMKSVANGSLNFILERTCCRSFYPDKKVTNKQLEYILKAGQAAPSAKNRQPYFFIVIRNDECKKEIVNAANEGRKRQFAHLSTQDFKKMETGPTGSNDGAILEAPVSILVMRDSDPSYAEAGNQSRNLLIKEESGVAAAAYSIMLGAHALGLSTDWLCSPLYIKDELKNILPKYGVVWKETWEPRVIIPVGYSAIPLKKPTRISLTNKMVKVE